MLDNTVCGGVHMNIKYFSVKLLLLLFQHFSNHIPLNVSSALILLLVLRLSAIAFPHRITVKYLIWCYTIVLYFRTYCEKM